MERKTITTEELMDKIDIFRDIFSKVDGFGWWYLERIQTGAGTQFTSEEFQEGLSVHLIQLILAAPCHQ